jgi:hypothetical protein
MISVLLPPDHRHELNFLIPITLLEMTTITVIDHGMSLSVLYIIATIGFGPVQTVWDSFSLYFLPLQTFDKTNDYVDLT